MKKSLLLLLIAIGFGCQKPKFDTIIRQAVIYDGTGGDSLRGDVGINGDTIAFIGDLSKAVSDQTIDATGLALSPGFIDTHSHHASGLNREPEALAVVSQGITTIIIGQDGGSYTPLREYYKKLSDSAVAINIGSYSGHNSIRDRVMGKDFKRHATAMEVDSMIQLLKADMEAGAFGLSTGLEYDPGIYSHKDEVMALSKVLPDFNGRYISHLRSEDRFFWDALDEIITIGREAKIPVQISHLKLAMRSLWGKADTTLQILDKARNEGIQITADIYPYTYWSSTIRVLFPERNFTDEKEAALILKAITSPEGIIFSRYEPNPDYNGKSLAEVALLEKKTPEKMLLELIRRLDQCDTKGQECDGSIVATSMEEEDVKKLMKWNYTNICSDGSSSGRHPRGFGAFTKVLNHYVLQTHTLTLAEAIYKMTGLASENLTIPKRGKIKVGNYADLVLFDPSRVTDHSTIQDPQAISTGIMHVWVNGVEVYNEHGVTKKYPGKVILRSDN
jgi:N-acyl-D-amino-acid deacylase